MCRCLFAIIVLLMLAACSTVPPTSVHQPMTARPSDRIVRAPADGAIFHAGIDERPLFEDKRARNIGDILTITIAEKMVANRKATASSTYANSIDAAIPTVSTNMPEVLLSSIPVVGNAAANLLSRLFSLNGTVSGESNNKTSSSSAGAANEDLTGSITVTVIDVLPNGNLLVSGEKQIAINTTDEFIRFSGVVDPTTINNQNTVLSTKVADAHIEYKNAGAMNELKNDMMALGFLGRFFMSVLPF